MRTDHSEVNKYHSLNLNVYSEKIQALESELTNMKRQMLNVTLTSDNKTKRLGDETSDSSTMLKTLPMKASFSDTTKLVENDKSLQAISKRLDLVELIADDYLEIHIEKEVMKSQQKLANTSFGLEEKLGAYSCILQHYRLVNNSLMTNCFSKIMEVLNSNKNATQ